MYATDRRSNDSEHKKDDSNTCVAILLGADGHLQNKKLLRFVRDTKTKMWKIEKEKKVTGGKAALSEIRNLSLLDKELILLVTTTAYFVYNDEFQLIKLSYFKKSALTWAPEPAVSCFVSEFSK